MHAGRRSLWIFLFCAAGVTAAAQRPLGERVDDAVRDGRRALLARQESTGRFGQGGEHALVTLALLHAGVPAMDAKMVRAIERLAEPLTGTYARALRLMVIDLVREKTSVRGHFLHDALLMRRAHEDARILVDGQGGEGAWSYGDRRSASYDNSNAQYAVLGLRAAARLGIEIDETCWRMALRHFLSQIVQKGTGSTGMGYTGDGPATPSMTAALVASLAVCAEHSGDVSRSRVRAADERAAAYLEEKWRAGTGLHGYYTLYGMERAMGLTQRHRLGARDWYSEGATFLLAEQLDGGLWPDGGGDARCTSFALLFLVRATRRKGGETPMAVARVLDALPADAAAEAVERAAGELLARGTAAVPQLVLYLRDGVAARRAAALAALRRITGETLGYDPALSIAQNASALAAWRAVVERQVDDEQARRSP
jgi:hypothetical protein